MKIRRIIIAIAFLVVSCLREEPDEVLAIKTYECFTVSMDDDAITKVSMGDNYSVKWTSWDHIVVFSDIQGPVQYNRGWDGKFYGEPVSGTKFYAYWDNGYFQYSEATPSVLTYTPGLYGTCGEDYIDIPIVAANEDNNLIFRQTCGLLHFRIKSNNPVYHVELRGNNDEVIYWPGTINVSESSPTLRLTELDDTYDPNSWWQYSVMSVSIPVDDQKTGEWNLFFPLPEMTFEGGFTLKVYYDDETGWHYYNKATQKKVDIKRGEAKSFSTIELDREVTEFNKGQREALIALYNSLDGDHWSINSNWCSEKPLNEWYGVYIDEGGYVKKLEMVSNNLKGVLPSEIAQLSYLTMLDLSYNPQLTGQLPKELFQLQDLSYIMFNGCGFTGAIPSEIGAMKNLSSLLVFGNNLTGEVPKEISLLKNLSSIDLAGNQLTGPLPEFSPSVRDDICVVLNDNKFSGPIPESYGTYSNAKFKLNFNNLSGDVPLNFQQHHSWEYAWPYHIAQFGDGFNWNSISLRGPKFTAYSTEGTTIDDSIYEKNEYTLLFEFSSRYNLDFYKDVYTLYCNYKKKGLEVIGYCGGVSNEELKQCISSYGFPWMNFRYDGASTVSSFIPFDWDNPIYMLNNRYPAVNVIDHNGNIVYTPYVAGTVDFLYNDDGSVCINGETMNTLVGSLTAFIEEQLGEPDPFIPQGPEVPYESVDYSSDGSVHTLQVATVGKGIDIVLMGDAFSDRLIADGTYERQMRRAYEAVFSEEPYKSYQACFNVYYVDVVSKNETYYGERALESYFGSGTLVGGSLGKVQEYASRAVNMDDRDKVAVLVLMNADIYAGTCYMFGPSSEARDYGEGLTISFVPTDSYDYSFAGTVLHEVGGHGIAKLGDEYYYVDNGQIPESEVSGKQNEAKYGWWKNIDFTDDPSLVKWNVFIADSRYDAESIGVYQGACTYYWGAYRPTINSIMNKNTEGFNAPSRYAIWYRINKLAYGDEWTGTYEDFVEFDLAHRPTTTTTLTKSSNFVEQQFPPLHPPVIVDKDWREVVSGR